MKNWQIIDDEGVIASAHNEFEMRELFNIMTEDETMRWKGDLKLVQVHRWSK